MTLYYQAVNSKHIREVYQALEAGIFRDAVFGRNVTISGDLTLSGTFYMGNAELDALILTGRFTTSTIAGANVELDASYTYGEAWELRYKVTSWTGIAGSFAGYYFRAEAGLGNMSYGLRGMEVYGVSNITAGTTGIDQLCGAYITAYTKAFSGGSYTINRIYGIEANFGQEALTALTITTQASALYATVQTTSGILDYSKIHGVIVEGGDAASRTYGHAIVVQNPTWSGCAAQTWTTGLYINEACTTGISINGVTTTGFAISGDCATAISITSGVSATNVILIAATAGTAGLSITGDCTNGITIAAQTTSGITISGATADGILISGACSDAIRISGANSTSAIHITGDQAIGLLYDVSAGATEGIKIMVADGVTVATGISLVRTTTTGICTTGISIDTDGTTGLSIGTGFTGADMILLAGTGSTSGIRISGACATAIQVTGSATTAFGILTGTFGTGISLAGTITTGISLPVANGATITTGIDMTCTGTGTITNAISLTYTASATECFAVTLANGQTITRGMSLSGAGTYTTGILLDATAIGTGISISGASTTAIDISGACTTGLASVGTVNVTISAPAAAKNGIYSLVNASAGWSAGNVVAIRGKVIVSGTDLKVSKTAVWAGIELGSVYTETGLTCAVNAQISSTTVQAPNAIVYIQSLPLSGASFANVPYLVFSEGINAPPAGTGSNILFEVGHNAAGTVPTIGASNLFYNHTIQIAVNETAGVRTPFYIPLSTAAGTYTTPYPIVTTSTLTQTIDLGAIVATTAIGTTLTSTGAFSGPPQQGVLIGLKVAVTGTGDNGMDARAIYATYTTAGKVMTGFYSAGSFETVSNNTTDQCDSAILDLRDNDSGTAGHPATSYIRLRIKGSQLSDTGRRNFVNFYDEDEGNAYNSGHMLCSTSAQTQTHSIRCFINDTPIYLMATTTAPAV